MRTPMRRLSAICAAALLIAAAEAARADELLVMPYACAVIGGKPALTPAPDQGHLIVGRREQRKFTACSPVDPTLCRQWTVHKFTLDCGGVRVPWTSVATGDGAPGQRRARMVDGRVQLRMPMRWVLASNDPCARGADFGDRWRYGRLGRFCADRMALSPPAVVELPPGFAPLLGMDAIFVPQGQRRGPNVVGAPWAAATTADLARSKNAATRSQDQGALGQVSARADATSIAPPKPMVRVGQAKPQADRLPASGVPSDVVRGQSSSGGPRIINAPEPASRRVAAPSATAVQTGPSAKAAPAAGGVAGEAQPIEVPKPVPAIRPSERNLAFAAPLQAENDSSPATGPVVTNDPSAVASKGAVTGSLEARSSDQSRESSTVIVDLISVAGQPIVTIATGVAAFGALLLLAFAMRRQGGARSANLVQQRDIGAISLGDGFPSTSTAIAVRGQQASRDAPLAIARAIAPPPLPAPVEAALPPGRNVTSAIAVSAPPPEPKPFQSDVPRTREQALKVLGMGVRPGTGDMALKKIVDGLRLTWHPDSAVDELDRLEREIRLKQINAAWEIISGKREETPSPRLPPPLPQREDAQSA